jgi:hypothetical protein
VKIRACAPNSPFSVRRWRSVERRRQVAFKLPFANSADSICLCVFARKTPSFRGVSPFSTCTRASQDISPALLFIARGFPLMAPSRRWFSASCACFSAPASQRCAGAERVLFPCPGEWSFLTARRLTGLRRRYLWGSHPKKDWKGGL